MSYRIGKTFTFDAAHRLDHLHAEHKCARPHGHTYQLTLHLEAYDLDEDGFVMDYGNLTPVKEWVADQLDHRDLSAKLPGRGTTAENLARWTYETWAPFLPLLVAVTVRETPNTYAEYRPYG